MRAGAVRTELGLSRHRVARFAGVSEQRVALYEARTDAVADATRKKLDRVYGILSEMLARLMAGS